MVKRNYRKIDLLDLGAFSTNSGTSAYEHQTNQFLKETSQEVRAEYTSDNSWFGHETRSHRMETEAPIIMRNSVGYQAAEDNKQNNKLCSAEFAARINDMSECDILNMELGIIDFMIFVKYGNGWCLPAEVAISTVTIKGGLDPMNEYNALPKITHELLNAMGSGYTFEAKQSAEVSHGIDVFDTKKRINIQQLCNEIEKELKDDMLLLCRGEDLNKVLGSWSWLQKYGNLRKDLNVLTFEEFLTHTMMHLKIIKNIDRPPNTRSQITELMSKTKYNYTSVFRCDFHNTQAGCDKLGCALKNVKMYFCFMSELLSEYLDFELKNGMHFFEDISNQNIMTQRQLVTPNKRNNNTANNVISGSEQFVQIPRKPNVEFSLSARCNGSCKSNISHESSFESLSDFTSAKLSAGATKDLYNNKTTTKTISTHKTIKRKDKNAKQKKIEPSNRWLILCSSSDTEESSGSDSKYSFETYNINSDENRRFHKDDKRIRVKILVPYYTAGAIIGPKASKINQLKAETNSHIYVSGVGQFCPGTKEQVVLVTAMKEDVLVVIKSISSILRSQVFTKKVKFLKCDCAEKRRSFMIFLLPSSIVSKLVDKYDESLKKLEYKFNVMIDVAPIDKIIPVLDEQSLEIYGGEENVLKACTEIFNLMGEDYQVRLSGNLEYRSHSDTDKVGVSGNQDSTTNKFDQDNLGMSYYEGCCNPDCTVPTSVHMDNFINRNIPKNVPKERKKYDTTFKDVKIFTSNLEKTETVLSLKSASPKLSFPSFARDVPIKSNPEVSSSLKSQKELSNTPTTNSASKIKSHSSASNEYVSLIPRKPKSSSKSDKGSKPDKSDFKLCNLTYDYNDSCKPMSRHTVNISQISEEATVTEKDADTIVNKEVKSESHTLAFDDYYFGKGPSSSDKKPSATLPRMPSKKSNKTLSTVDHSDPRLISKSSPRSPSPVSAMSSHPDLSLSEPPPGFSNHLPRPAPVGPPPGFDLVNDVAKSLRHDGTIVSTIQNISIVTTSGTSYKHDDITSDSAAPKKRIKSRGRRPKEVIQ